MAQSVTHTHQCDVVIVGASIAGCTAATLYGQAGVKVALIESHSDANHFKSLCTHFIQACATPTIKRLGLAEPLEQAGAIRNAAYFHTEFGWVHAPDRDDVYGYNVRREVLDPLLRDKAAGTPNVELSLGLTATELTRGTKKSTLVATDRSGNRHEFSARLIVGADGRTTKTAELAGIVSKPSPNGRFAYFAHFRDVDLFSGTDSTMWFDLPDVAYAFPNDDGVVVMAVMPAMDKLPRFKEDLEGTFLKTFERLPLAPDLSRAQRVSKIFGTLDMTNRRRTVADDQVALIGDAAMTSDPLWGIGCGWAFQSAQWLVDETASAISAGAGIETALARYRRLHGRRLGGHNFMINDFAKARQFNRIERLLWNGAVWDPKLAQHLEDFGNRLIGPSKLFTPSVLRRGLKAARMAKHASPPQPAAVMAAGSSHAVVQPDRSDARVSSEVS